MVLCLFLNLNCYKFLFLRKLENLLHRHFPDSLPQMSKLISEAATRSVLCKKAFLEILNNLQENTCARVSCRPQTCIFIKKETLAQVFSCKLSNISKNSFFAELLWWLLPSGSNEPHSGWKVFSVLIV